MSNKPAGTPRRGPLGRAAVGMIVGLFYVLGTALVWLAHRLSYPKALRLGMLVTQVFSPLTREKRHRNWRRFFAGAGWSEERFTQLDADHLRYLARMRTEVARAYSGSPEDLLRQVKMVGEEHLQAALEKKRGVLLITGHTGTWWQTPAFLAAKGYPVTAVFTAIPFRRIERALFNLTNRYRVKLAFVGRDAYRAAKQVIEHNGIFYLTFDVAVRGHHADSLPWGGGTLEIDPGPAILALRNHLPVIQAACAHGAAHETILTIYPADELTFPTDEATPQDLTRRWTERLEREIRERPEQWWPWGYVELGEQTGAGVRQIEQPESSPSS